MTTLTAKDIAAPPTNRDMKVLDRSFFHREVQTAALMVSQPQHISNIRNKISSSNELLSTTTIRPIIDDPIQTGNKIIRLLPQVNATERSTWSSTLMEIVESGAASIQPYELKLTYEDWSFGDILDAVLPELAEHDEQNPAGFAQIGHVAHLNLRENFLPYKHLIGQVLIDKTNLVRTVINKIQDVGTESVYRTFPYEVLAGPDDLNVSVRHADCDFKFNFAEVYWNPRNGHEHERLLSKFQPGQAICDVMAGVGPFAVPAAKRQVWTWANDLNPACYSALVSAAKANKVDRFIQNFNMDGVEFIRKAVPELLAKQRHVKIVPPVKIPRNSTPQQKAEAMVFAQNHATITKEPATFDHFIMNLPALAIEFLYAFRGIYRGSQHHFTTHGGSSRLPMIHVY